MRISIGAGTAAALLLLAPLAAQTHHPAHARRAAHPPRTLEVRMVNDGHTAHFVPAQVTAHPGDRIRFVNVVGGPHNVSFNPATLPDDVRRALSAGMPNQIQPLWSPLLTDAGQTYTVSLDGVKPGRYDFFCMPHMSMGMKGVLVVQ